jgi:hypothetical protein
MDAKEKLMACLNWPIGHVCEHSREDNAALDREPETGQRRLTVGKPEIPHA